MQAQSQVSDLRAESVQLALLRKAGVARRLATALSLSRTVIGLARAAIRRRCPDLDERQLLLRFVELHYGAGLAEKLRNDLARRIPFAVQDERRIPGGLQNGGAPVRA